MELDDSTKGLGIYVVDDLFEKRCQFNYLNNDLVLKYGDSALPWYQSIETRNINIHFPSYEDVMGNSCIFESFHDECFRIKYGVKRINDYDYYIDYCNIERNRYDLFYCEQILKTGINETSSSLK